METKNIHENIVCYDGYSIQSKPELQDFLKQGNLEGFLDAIQQNVILVLGGDGTMLRAVSENYEKNLPFLGINFGSIGFLLNDRKYLESINKYKSRQYPLLEIRKNNELVGTALNDVNLYSPDGKVVDIDVNLEKNRHTNIKGDGLIISTPAGSTGHNKSYSGTILKHGSGDIIITPKGSINAQSSKNVDDEEVIFIKNTGRKNILGVNADGNQILVGEDISLEIRKSKQQVEFLILENYVEEWDNKGFNS